MYSLLERTDSGAWDLSAFRQWLEVAPEDPHYRSLSVQVDYPHSDAKKLSAK